MVPGHSPIDPRRIEKSREFMKISTFSGNLPKSENFAPPKLSGFPMEFHETCPRRCALTNYIDVFPQNNRLSEGISRKSRKCARKLSLVAASVAVLLPTALYYVLPRGEPSTWSRAGELKRRSPSTSNPSEIFKKLAKTSN